MKAKLILEDGTEFNVTVDESELSNTETGKRWRTKYNDDYFFVDGRGQVWNNTWGNDELDKWRYSQRNVFRTRKEAEQHLAVLKARAAILDHADEVNEGWEPDWSEEHRQKYFVIYDWINMELTTTSARSIQGVDLAVYKSKEAAEDAISKVGDAYLTVLGVEKR